MIIVPFGASVITFPDLNFTRTCSFETNNISLVWLMNWNPTSSVYLLPGEGLITKLNSRLGVNPTATMLVVVGML